MCHQKCISFFHFKPLWSYGAVFLRVGLVCTHKDTHNKQTAPTHIWILTGQVCCLCCCVCLCLCLYVCLVCLCVSQLALLNPIENPYLELAIVMLIVPFFINVRLLFLFVFSCNHSHCRFFDCK